MSIIAPPFLQCNTEDEYRTIFITELVNSKLKFCGYDLVILEKDFDHVCFEKGKSSVEKGQFGIRRSRRLLFIKAMCEKTIPYKIIYQKERDNKSICILFEELDTAVYLKPIRTNRGDYFKLLTLVAFGEGVSKKIEKQYSQGDIIDNVEFIFEEAV